MWSLLVVCLAVMLRVAPAAATEPELERFPLPGVHTADDPVSGPDGAVWFLPRRGVGRIAPDGRVTIYPAPQLIHLAAGPDDALWATTFSRNRGFRDGLLRIDLDGRTRTVGERELAGVHYTALAAGADEDLLVGKARPAQILRLTPTGTVTARVKLPSDAAPSAISVAPDGTAWFLHQDGFGRLGPDGQLQLYRDRGVDVSGYIAATPDGSAWARPWRGRWLLRLNPDGSVRRVPIGLEPRSVEAGPDGAAWFSFFGAPGGVGRIAADGTGLRVWREPFGGHGPHGGLAFDGHGNLWGAAVSEHSLHRLALGEPPPAGSPLEPLLARRGLLRHPYTLRAGVDRAMWLTTKHGVVRLDANGKPAGFGEGSARHASDVLPNVDGSAWLALNGPGVAKLRPDGSVRRYSRGFPSRAKVFALARGKGRTLWYIDARTEAIGRWTPGGRARQFRRGLGRRPDLLAITRGPDGRVWATDQSGAIIAVSSSGRVRRYTRGLGRRPEPTAITAGPDGNLWFTMFSRRRIGRIKPDGRVRLWRTREAPASIAPGPDGALWFSTAATILPDTLSGIGRIDIRGHVQEFFVRASRRTGYQTVAPGSDGKVWFLVDRGPTAVARMDPARLAELGVLPAP